ncbi:MAG: AraC family transcriptional regulator [Pseudomonadales bacterium]
MSTAAFQLYLWPHRVVYLGVSPDNERHRHHAAQLCVGLDADVQVRASADDTWLSAKAVLIPPDQDHQVDAGSGRILALYWEPESDDYPFNDIPETLQPYPVTADGRDWLRQSFDDRPDAAQLWARCEYAFNIQSRKSLAGADARVNAVINHIRRVPQEDHGVDALAARVHLSPSRLSHLFKAHVGVPIRQFVLWTRARTVVVLAVKGATLTEAAHATGFADAAHMSNAFRRMFGFAPSALFIQTVPKVIVVVGD